MASRYGLKFEADVPVVVRDGTKTYADVYRPDAPGRFPALLTRTPYDKSEVERNSGFGRFFAQRGYVSIIQDCRGTFRSEGAVNFLVPEAEDGFDALEWIDRQPWSDGQVGSWGTSWSGWTQTAMAALGPKNLKAMIPNMSGAIGHESSVRSN